MHALTSLHHLHLPPPLHNHISMYHHKGRIVGQCGALLALLGLCQRHQHCRRGEKLLSSLWAGGQFGIDFVRTVCAMDFGDPCRLAGWGGQMGSFPQGTYALDSLILFIRMALFRTITNSHLSHMTSQTFVYLFLTHHLPI